MTPRSSVFLRLDLRQDVDEVLGRWILREGFHIRREESDQEISLAFCDVGLLVKEVGVKPGLVLDGKDNSPVRANVLCQPPAARLGSTIMAVEHSN